MLKRVWEKDKLANPTHSSTFKSSVYARACCMRACCMRACCMRTCRRWSNERVVAMPFFHWRTVHCILQSQASPCTLAIMDYVLVAFRNRYWLVLAFVTFNSDCKIISRLKILVFSKRIYNLSSKNISGECDEFFICLKFRLKK